MEGPDESKPHRYGPKPTPPSAPFSPKARLHVEVKFAPFASGTRRFVPGKVRHAFLSLVPVQFVLTTCSRTGHRSQRLSRDPAAIARPGSHPRNPPEITDRPLHYDSRVGRLGWGCVNVSLIPADTSPAGLGIHTDRNLRVQRSNGRISRTGLRRHQHARFGHGLLCCKCSRISETRSKPKPLHAPALCAGSPGQSTASVARSDSRGSSERTVLPFPRLCPGDGNRDQSQTRGRVSASGARRGQFDRPPGASGSADRLTLVVPYRL